MAEKEYIEREALIKKLNEAPAYFDSGDIRYGIDVATSEVIKQPIADVVPVRHGVWYFVNYGLGKCSVCGGTEHAPSYCEPPFCKHCGAKMDGKIKSEVSK